MHINKLFMILIFSMFMISFASAWDFDNNYKYTPETETVEIHDCSFWLFGCLIDGEKLATLDLIEGNTKVPAGEEIRVGSFGVTFESDHSIDVFDNLIVDDLKNRGRMQGRNQNFKVKRVEQVQTEIYENNCTVTGQEEITNGTNTTIVDIVACEEIFIGYEDVNQVDWVDTKNPNFNFVAGEYYEIGVFMDIEAGDHGDWMPDLMGVVVEEWAEFQQSTAVGLINYYRMDETSGLVLDEISNNHGTNTGATQGVAGKINGSYDFELSDASDFIDFPALDIDEQDFTFCMWMWMETGTGSTQVPFEWGPLSTTYGFKEIVLDSGNINVKMGTNTGYPTYSYAGTNEWVHVCGQRDESNSKALIYFNGNSVANGSIGTDDINVRETLTIGAKAGTSFWYDGKIDEVGMWNRVLTPTEITEIYNSGTGLQNPRTTGVNTTDGDYTVVTFNASAGIGEFIVPQNVNNVSVLVVAGGGAGHGNLGGGGGAGGLIYNNSYNITGILNFTVIVGSGGLNTYGSETAGQNSSFGSLNALGGGVGGVIDNNGGSGGSGGGGGSKGSAGDTLGGAGLTGQGYAGGDGCGGCAGFGGGGGGGSSEVGGDGIANFAGDGGDGLQYSINGTATYYAGGGGGSTQAGSGAGSGGLGGGGDGGQNGVSGTAGIDGLGAGGGSGGSSLSGGSGGDGIVIIRYTTVTPDVSPTINGYNVSANYTATGSYDFVFDAYDDIDLDNVSVYVNDVLNQTDTSGVNNTNYTFSIPLNDGTYTILGEATDNASQSTNTSAITIIVDATDPTVTDALGLVDQTTFTLPINSTWNYTATDTHIDQCYYNTTANATQTVITCNSSIITSWSTGGNKTIQYCANDTFGLETCKTDYLYIYYIQDSQTESADPTVEGLDVTWTLTTNLTNTPTQTAYIVINDTMYDATTTTASADSYYFTFTKNIPDGWGNTTGNVLDWYWNYSITGVVDNRTTTTENITVYELAIDNCSTYGDVILNMSLIDEELTTVINGSAGANVEIDLNLRSKTNSSITLDYSNIWTNDNNPLVCIPANVLNFSQYWMEFTIGFSSTDHVWEFFYLDNGTLNSSKVFDTQTSTPLNLYDLLSTDSTSFLFNYFDQDGLPVNNAMVHIYRKYIGSGLFREVERAKADQNGDTIVHLVEEDVIYYFVISQYGEILFTSSTYTALCQATPCTIQIEAGGDFAEFPVDWDLVDGGAYDISSSASTRQVELDFTDEAITTYNLTVYKYNSDGTYTALNSSIDTGTSGTITMTVPQSAGNVSFFATVIKDDTFINSEWIDFTGTASDRFGITTALFIASLIILCLGLMAVSEGVGTLVFVILGVMLSGFLGLIQTELSTGVNIVVYLVIAGAILLWKLTGGRR